MKFRMDGKESLRPNGYQSRLVDAKLHHLLTNHRIVRLVGPHGAGKTWSALAQARSIVPADDEGLRPILESAPGQALSGGQAPHAIDEWQLVPRLARHVAQGGHGPYLLVSSMDRRPSDERYLSGSPTLRLWPFTLSESGLSNMSVSLTGLFSGDFYPLSSPMGLPEVAEALCRGGWPRMQGLDCDAAQRLVRIIMQTAMDREVAHAGKRTSMAVRVACAQAAAGWQATHEDLARCMAESGERPCSRNTAREYLALLERAYLVHPVEGWLAPVRAQSRVRIKPRPMFVDPSLPAVLLSQTPDTLLGDAPTLLSLLRCLVLRDVSAYASVLDVGGDATVRYYSDSDGGGADAVVTLADGRWGALNVAIGEGQVEEAMRRLTRLRSKLGKNPDGACPAPSWLAVVLAQCNRPRLDRRTGVYVFPLGCLTV